MLVPMWALVGIELPSAVAIGGFAGWSTRRSLRQAGVAELILPAPRDIPWLSAPAVAGALMLVLAAGGFASQGVSGFLTPLGLIVMHGTSLAVIATLPRHSAVFGDRGIWCHFNLVRLRSVRSHCWHGDSLGLRGRLGLFTRTRWYPIPSEFRPQVEAYLAAHGIPFVPLAQPEVVTT